MAEASVRLYFTSDGKLENRHFVISDAYAIHLIEVLKEAGWREV